MERFKSKKRRWGSRWSVQQLFGENRTPVHKFLVPVPRAYSFMFFNSGIYFGIAEDNCWQGGGAGTTR